MSLTSHSRVGKIHVAPCSCELHVRIRELEAEVMEARAWIAHAKEWVAQGDANWQVRLSEETARAEKVERERNDWERTANENGARVAELERELALANTPDGLEREAD